MQRKNLNLAVDIDLTITYSSYIETKRGTKVQILNTAEEVQVVGGGETTSFSIAMNGKAFRVLSDTLYKNKIGSIVRELSCNAYDAHVMNGNADEPFEIHLPDNFEPWFAVKDYGIGLSPSDIKTVFTKYFESTKTNNNDTIGAFGLGAKTPFSYTDQFTITSVKDGVCSIYSAYITSSGIPDITLMMAQPSDERTGVEIKMSVKINDFWQFKSEVKSQLMYFKVKPVVENAVGFSFDSEPECVYSSENISVANCGGGHVIIQGNVGYPLEYSMITNKISDDAMTFLRNLSKQHVRIVFPIGQIGVTASREGIEYNEFTCKNIETRLLEVQKEIEEFIEQQVSAIPTFWEKAKFLNENRIFNLNVGINSVKFPSNVSVHSNVIQFDITDVVFKTNIVNNGSVNNSVKVRQMDLRYVNRYSRSSVVYGTSYMLDESVAFVIVDKSTFISKRIELFFEDNKKINTVYRINVYDKSNFSDIKDKLAKLLGDFPNVILATDIVVPEAVKAERKKSKVTRYYINGEMQYATSNVRDWTKIYEEEVEEIQDKVAYVVVKNHKVVCEKERDAVDRYFEIRSFMKLVPVVAIRETALDDAKDNSNMIPLLDYIKEVEQNVVSDPEVVKQYNELVFARLMNSNVSSWLCAFHAKLQANGLEKLKITRILKKCNEAKELLSELEYTDAAIIEKKARFIGVAGSVIDKQTKRSNLYSNIIKKELDKLPLLDQYYSLSYTAKQKITEDHLIKYVKCMSV